LQFNIETCMGASIFVTAKAENPSAGLYKLTFYCSRCKARKPLFKTCYGFSAICEECSQYLHAESEKDFQRMRRQG